MLRNYFKIAIRQFRKQKMYSAIKIGGFAMSIAACLLIALFIKDELSYDKAIPNGEHIYRIAGKFRDNGTTQQGVSFWPPMAKALEKDFPEIEKAARLMPNTLFNGAGSNYIRRPDEQQNSYESGFSYADQGMIDILSLPMVYGNRSTALSEPGTMIISKTKADKYFPNQNPVGKTLMLNDDKNKIYKIGGVMKDFPKNSHLQYDFFLTLTGVEFWKGEQEGWGSSNYPTYILLKPGTDVARFEKKMSDGIIQKYFIPELVAGGMKDAKEFEKKLNLYLQPVKEIHLNADVRDDLSHGDIRFVWLFGGVALFILIIACINFINLSTAKSANRAKEVGLRKVVGSYRSGLIKQFLTESLVYSFLSFVSGLMIAVALLPYFNKLSAKSLTIPWTQWWLLPMMIGAAIVIGILAGLYPSFYLSSFKPISVLKGQLSKGSKNSLLRNGLVVFQFTTSIILIIGTIVIYKQTHFILNQKVGFEKDQVMLIQGTNTLHDETTIRSFKNELLKLPQVKSVSIGDYLPISGTKRNGNTFFNEGKTKDEPGTSTQFWIVDEDYVNTMGMKIVEGRNLSSQMASDSQAVVINQTMAKQLNLKNPIGKRITNGNVFTIVGVVQDFNFESMRDNIGAVCMFRGISPSIVSVKLKTTDVKNVVPAISDVWKKFAPSQPIRYTFMDESFKNMYDDVQRMGGIFTSFAILAIIIACLGLFALSAFMAEQRNKEIGIRKVLGASVSSITTMLSKDFVKLIFIAIVIASPIAWWAMNKWLQDFVYRITISWWMLGIAALVAIVIALITISFQSVKAALMNPVDSLRSE